MRFFNVALSRAGFFWICSFLYYSENKSSVKEKCERFMVGYQVSSRDRQLVYSRVFARPLHIYLGLEYFAPPPLKRAI
jgi:hypothetical protein